MRANRSRVLLAAGVAGAGSLGVGAAAAPAAPPASPILSVDFNNLSNNVSSTTQSGFIGYSPTGAFSQQFTASDGELISIAASAATGDSIATRDRSAGTPHATNSGSFTYADLYNDFFFQSGGAATATANSNAMTIQLTGLTVGQTYLVQFFAWDPNPNTSSATSTDTFTNTTSGNGSNSGSVTFARGTLPATGNLNANNDPNDLNNYDSTTLSGTADVNGSLTFTEFAAKGSGQTVPVLNALVIGTTASPEPGSLGVFGLAAAGLLARRRRVDAP